MQDEFYKANLRTPTPAPDLTTYVSLLIGSLGTAFWQTAQLNWGLHDVHQAVLSQYKANKRLSRVFAVSLVYALFCFWIGMCVMTFGVSTH
jgi:hypothetical protein